MNLCLSIVICTLNREQVLCQTLRSISAIIRERSDVELIVVDQTLQHERVTEACLTELAWRMRLFRVDFASLTRARNFGISKARGEIVLFLDDDIEPSVDLISEHLACYSNSRVWGVGGCTLLPGGRKKTKSEFTAGEILDMNEPRKHRFDLDWKRQILWAPGCNMSFRREKLILVGGFDEQFYGMAIGEEVELCHRICRAGGIIEYSPGAQVLHLVNPSGGCRDARVEKERIAQLFDNALYLMRRSDRSFFDCLASLYQHCQAIAVSRKTLRELTFVQRLYWCMSGLKRAFSGRNREPRLPFRKVS